MNLHQTSPLNKVEYNTTAYSSKHLGVNTISLDKFENSIKNNSLNLNDAL